MIMRPLMEQVAVAYATEIEEQQAEIEQLQENLNTIVEQCAQAAFAVEAEMPYRSREAVVAAIRALKK